MTGYFGDIAPVAYEGPDTDAELAFRHYNPDEVVMGKRLEDHLRFALAWWHSFAWPGNDPFGGQTFERPWFGDTMELARLKADVAFDLFGLLGQPFFCFHDADIRPEGDDFRETTRNLEAMVDYLGEKMEGGGPRLLWGTANLFTHRRFMAGAATNPDPDVFAYSAATVKSCMDATHKLGGENYVLWGGREGYETLLNTDLARERRQAGRFLQMVVDYKHKIGFKGAILVEPKPQEPSKHQYDYDVATVYGFLKDFGLEGEVKMNVEQGHAILAGHSVRVGHRSVSEQCPGGCAGLLRSPEGRWFHDRGHEFRRETSPPVAGSGRSDRCACRCDGCLRRRSEGGGPHARGWPVGDSSRGAICGLGQARGAGHAELG